MRPLSIYKRFEFPAVALFTIVRYIAVSPVSSRSTRTFVDEPAFPETLISHVPDASPPVRVGTLRNDRIALPSLQNRI